MRHISSAVLSALIALTLAFVSRPAAAGIEACGNIDVRAEASCVVAVKGRCDVQCQPTHFAAACTSNLENLCSGKCVASASATCNTTCKADCNAECTADPGKVDCEGRCQADCEGDCDGKCSSSGNKTDCTATCKGTCKSECTGHCTATPPSATCDAKCDASCTGECKAEAYVDCQVQCEKPYADCTARLTGGCQAQCEKPEGALFCDGDYVDTGDNLKNCIDALNAYLHVKVDSSGSASCDGNTCQAEGQVTASSSCAASPHGLYGGVGVSGLVALALGLSLVRRRRR